MRYSRLEWAHKSPDEPVEIMSEYDDDGWERRKVEVFKDGSVQFGGRGESAGGSQLSLIPRPPDVEVTLEPEFRVSDITSDVFEAAWSRARQTLTEVV